MIEQFGNIFRIPELRKKVLITLGLIALCRIGVYIPIPGIDTTVLKSYFHQFTQTGVGQLLGLVDMFAGGALASGAIFGLGVMPYISASIIFQLLVGVIPYLEKLQKEGDAGRKKINQYTRLTTVGLCLFQAFIMTRTLYTVEFNGIPVIPVHLQGFGFQIGMFLAIVCGIVYITQGQRRIPVQQAKHTRGRRVYGGQRHFLPLRVNQAGVMPIIFAQSLLIFPAAIMQGIQVRFEPGSFGYWITSRLSEVLQDGVIYVMLYILLITFFCYFWTAIQFNPKEMSNNMKDYVSFIPGIRPGQRTAEYLESIMGKITLAGAAFLALIAILPKIVAGGFELNRAIAGFYGGTGLLIIVGVALDMVQRIESHMIMRQYSGFLSGGTRIRARIG